MFCAGFKGLQAGIEPGLLDFSLVHGACALAGELTSTHVFRALILQPEKVEIILISLYAAGLCFVEILESR